MDSFGLLAILCLAPLIISIVVAVQFGNLKAAVEQLKRRVLELEGRSTGRSAEPSPPRRAIPPPLPDFLKPPPMSAAASQQRPSVAREPSPSFDWESVVGVKLFAWIGGLAFFLGVVFFVKYAFENNWITPEMRILAGALVGVALVIIGSLTPARRYRVPAQSLCATGVLILYADIYAAHSFYNLIPLTAATVFMWIVTGLALFLASHHAAQSVAWLGVIGGFLTPALLWTKSDNSMPLFIYIGVLNCGIATVSALKRWNHLIFLAAIGSVVIEFAWTADFFGPAHAETARIIFLGMEALFLAVCLVLHRSDRHDHWSTLATAVTGFAALLFCSLIIFFDIFNQHRYGADLILPVLFFANAGLVALGAIGRSTGAQGERLDFRSVGRARAYIPGRGHLARTSALDRRSVHGAGVVRCHSFGVHGDAVRLWCQSYLALGRCRGRRSDPILVCLSGCSAANRRHLDRIIAARLRHPGRDRRRVFGETPKCNARLRRLASGCAGRIDRAFCQPDLSGAVRSGMDHGRLGAGRSRTPFALSMGSERAPARRRAYRFLSRLCAPRAQSSRIRISSAQSRSHFQLVSLRLRHSGALLFCRRALVR